MSNGHGGARPNSGRKRGSPNRVTQAQRDAIIASGLTPLDYLLSVLRNEEMDVHTRMDAAKAAAPYVHPRLSQVDMSTQHTVSHEDRLFELFRSRELENSSHAGVSEPS
jgi:hypothetical protein